MLERGQGERYTSVYRGYLKPKARRDCPGKEYRKGTEKPKVRALGQPTFTILGEKDSMEETAKELPAG